MITDSTNNLKISNRSNIVSPQKRAINQVQTNPISHKGRGVIELSGRQLVRGLGAAALLLAGGLMAKPLNARVINKIENHYNELEKKLPEVQKQFQEIFLKDDISLDETKNMLKRYKAIERLGITGNKTEYITALFNEAKHNFGFDNSNIDLQIVSDVGRYGGGSGNYMSFIQVNKNAHGGHRRIMDIIHHEFRHKKQRFLASNYSIDAMQRAEGVAAHTHAIEMGRKVEDRETYVENWINSKDFIENTRQSLRHMYNIEDFDKSRVPKNQYEYVEKLIKSFEHNEDGMAGNYEVYRNQFYEVDAWDIGEKAAKLLSAY